MLRLSCETRVSLTDPEPTLSHFVFQLTRNCFANAYAVLGKHVFVECFKIYF